MAYWFWIVFFLLTTVLGLYLIVAAKSLSLRYNAWTTGVRTRRPGMEPPTPEMREKNTRIMTFLFRGTGLWMFPLSLIMLVLRSFAPR